MKNELNKTVEEKIEAIEAEMRRITDKIEQYRETNVNWAHIGTLNYILTELKGL